MLGKRLDYEPVEVEMIFPKGIMENKKDSLGSLKFKIDQLVPEIAEDSTLREQWENLYYEINQYKAQIDLDLQESINDIFMYFSQRAVSDEVKAEKSGNLGEMIYYNKLFIGKWLTLAEILSAKIERRKKFVNIN